MSDPVLDTALQENGVITSYEEVATMAAMIELVTQNNYMPPWPPDPNYTPHSLLDERFLTEDEKNLISQWVNQGLPEGDAELEAEIPTFTEKFKNSNVVLFNEAA